MRLSSMRMFGLVLWLLASALVLSGCFQVAGEPLDPTTAPAGGAMVAQPTNTSAAPPTDVIPPSPTFIPPSATVATSLGSTQAVDGAVPTTTPPGLAQAGIAPSATLQSAVQAGVLPTTTPAGQGGALVEPTSTLDLIAQATALVSGQGVQAATAVVAGQGGQDLQPSTAVAAQATLIPSPTPFQTFPSPTPAGQENLEATATQLIIEATQTVVAAQTATATAQGTTGPTPIITGTPTVDQSLDCVHVVRPGENMYRIALRYDVTQNEIVTVNGLANPRLLSVGQELTIPRCGNLEVRPTAVPSPTPTLAPGETATQPSGQTHIIQPGENLYRIALRYGVTMSALANANGIANINIIRAGDTLIIP